MISKINTDIIVQQYYSKIVFSIGFSCTLTINFKLHFLRKDL